MRPESPRTVFNFRLMLFNRMYNQTVSLNVHKIKDNTDIRACSLSVNRMSWSFVTTATEVYSFRIILGPIQLILK